MILSKVRERFSVKNDDFSRPVNIKSENFFSAKICESPRYRFERQSQIVRDVTASHWKVNNICFCRAKPHLEQESSHSFE